MPTRLAILRGRWIRWRQRWEAETARLLNQPRHLKREAGVKERGGLQQQQELGVKEGGVLLRQSHLQQVRVAKEREDAVRVVCWRREQRRERVMEEKEREGLQQQQELGVKERETAFAKTLAIFLITFYQKKTGMRTGLQRQQRQQQELGVKERGVLLRQSHLRQVRVAKEREDAVRVVCWRREQRREGVKEREGLQQQQQELGVKERGLLQQSYLQQVRVAKVRKGAAGAVESRVEQKREPVQTRPQQAGRPANGGPADQSPRVKPRASFPARPQCV
jgi:hypothetical protein